MVLVKGIQMFTAFFMVFGFGFGFEGIEGDRVYLGVYTLLLMNMGMLWKMGKSGLMWSWKKMKKIFEKGLTGCRYSV